jgi:hypothetical protein
MMRPDADGIRANSSDLLAAQRRAFMRTGMADDRAFRRQWPPGIVTKIRGNESKLIFRGLCRT